MRMIPFCLALLVAGGMSNHLSAQDSAQASMAPMEGYKMAVGLRFSSGTPTLSNSLSFKYFINEGNAIEGLVSYGNRFGFGALYEKYQLIGATPAFTWFYGVGGYAGFEGGKTWLGPTGIVGLDYKFQHAPINISLDWKPELDVSPSINFVPNAFALTARFVLF